MGRGSRAPCGCGARALCERGVRGPRYTGALAAARAGGRNSGCGAAPLPGRTPLPFIGRDPTPRVRSLTPSGRGARSRVAPLFAEDARRTERRGVVPAVSVVHRCLPDRDGSNAIENKRSTFYQPKYKHLGICPSGCDRVGALRRAARLITYFGGCEPHFRDWSIWAVSGKSGTAALSRNDR